MSLSVAIAAIVFADLAMLGMLAYVMSRAKLLTPHVSIGRAAVQTPAAVAPAKQQARVRRARAITVPSGA